MNVKKDVKVFILSGEGINCEEEMGRAFFLVGAQVDLVSILEWKKNPFLLLEYDIFVLPGGFSYADELGAGHILSCELSLVFHEVIDQFIQVKKGLILGVCNGFQVLIRLGLFDISPIDRKLALDCNQSGQFINTWASCRINSKAVCHWTKEIQKINLPIRHGEGRLVIDGDDVKQKQYFELLESMGQIVLQYDGDVNGSFNRIAGLCDRTGQVFGLMPHPEAALDEILYPREFSATLLFAKKIFENAVEYTLQKRFLHLLDKSKKIRTHHVEVRSINESYN